MFLSPDKGRGDFPEFGTPENLDACHVFIPFATMEKVGIPRSHFVTANRTVWTRMPTLCDFVPKNSCSLAAGGL
jgi:hypothetical protein